MKTASRGWEPVRKDEHCPRVFHCVPTSRLALPPTTDSTDVQQLGSDNTHRNHSLPETPQLPRLSAGCPHPNPGPSALCSPDPGVGVQGTTRHLQYKSRRQVHEQRKARQEERQRASKGTERAQGWDMVRGAREPTLRTRVSSTHRGRELGRCLEESSQAYLTGPPNPGMR